jgi:DNA-binding IscR family transcriptional regulator
LSTTPQSAMVAESYPAPGAGGQSTPTQRQGEFVRITTAIGLRDHNGYLRLTHFAMQRVGEAARTLGALLDLADRRSQSTRASLTTITQKCGLPRRTVQRHLQKLQTNGLIEVRPSRGPSTYRISDETWNTRIKYAAMPRWRFAGSWAATAVFSWLLSRVCMVEKLEQKGGCVDRQWASLREISHDTGLSKRSVARALQMLERERLVEVSKTLSTDQWFEFGLLPVSLSRNRRQSGVGQSGVPSAG